MSGEVRISKNPSGTWIGNVFYSDVIFERYLKNTNQESNGDLHYFIDLLPCDTERSDE
jgi:hypothetical protein